MASIVTFEKEDVIVKAKAIVAATGWESLNARGLAKELSISTKPLYRMFDGMEEVKKGVYDNIYKFYDEFITSRIDKEKALITLCVAYIEFAQEHKNLFKTLFLSNNLSWKSIDSVLDEKWNQSAIINLVNKHGYSFENAKVLFMHLWLYSNGLATLLATNDMKLDSNDIVKRIVAVYKDLVK
ncbi:MAG: TetR/AcrR family transcriptional regulator [Bacilli bacterium]|nr:TetR/AcrR family transcriptional regulator [Bacilli bacterium]